MRAIPAHNLHGRSKMTNKCSHQRTTGIQEGHHWKRSKTYPEHNNLDSSMANKMDTEDSSSRSSSSKDRIQIFTLCPEEDWCYHRRYQT